MLKKYKLHYTIFIILIFISVIFIILYLHNILPYLNFKIILLLLKNKINFLKFEINDDLSKNSPNSISSGDFQLLIEELLSN
jgi:hypothetical protein